jgi:hypothetical protein
MSPKNELMFLLQARNWEEALLHLKTDKATDTVREIDYEGCLPIHVACKKNAPAGVLKALIEVYPESVGIESFYDHALPIQIICNELGHHPTSDAVQAILAVSNGTNATFGPSAVHQPSSNLPNSTPLLNKRSDAVREC